MAKNFEITWQGGIGTHRPSSNPAIQGVLPTTLEPADQFDASTDQFVILEFIVPSTFTGLGTLKLRLIGAANTTTAADDSRWQVATEFRTAGASESLNADNFDGTTDDGTMTHSTTAYSMQELIITLTPAVTPVAGDRGRIKVNRDANNGGGLDDLAVVSFITDYAFYEEV